MRNQRKDRSVLDDMMATSKGIEPAEVSYHPNGDFRGSRDIFGPLSTDGSPVCSNLGLTLFGDMTDLNLGSGNPVTQETQDTKDCLGRHQC